MAVQEQERRQRLVLGRGAGSTTFRQGAEELADLLHAQFVRVAAAVESDVAPDPAHVGLLRSATVVARADRLPDTVEELWCARGGLLTDEETARLAGRRGGY